MMRDYAELIKRLRKCEANCSIFDCENCAGNDCEAYDSIVFKVAADAIEELLAECDDWETIAKYKAKIIEKMESEQRDIMRQLPTWISVEERLPKIGERVLIMFKPFEDDENISIGWLTKYGFDCYDDSVYFYRSVTHWIPLPKPPKEVE